MAEPVTLNRASSCESVNNYPIIPSSVHVIDSGKAVSEPSNKFPIDLNRSPPPDSSNDENEYVFVNNKGDVAASGIGKSEIPKGGVEEGSSFWANKKTKFFKWLGATAKIFKKRNDRSD
ncbi:uncharacterized protein LOC114917064 isoform X2 [Cajanus cajan]|uniref:uncharacterized protein LOC114917064 isoform X1 n=1 Tax=Cajanus cajan TaxID=3821 RepID=UPI0010FB17DF|nr:uncharacterized protein LOC114917064 isoform X1 [Cajanus cajan]XP_029130840.1 uncharacterized protein LOC114917064 isoform X2 [Cajanus cajan]